MKIRLADFKEGDVVDVAHDYDPSELDLEFIDLKYSKGLHLEGSVEKGSDTLTFRGRLQSEIEHICGRCLKRIKNKVDQPFELYYETTGNEWIDTTDDLREVLILDHPISFVCKDTCKGLCSHCGINRNETSCECSPQTAAASRGAFVQLKQLWEQKQEKRQHG